MSKDCIVIELEITFVCDKLKLDLVNLVNFVELQFKPLLSILISTHVLSQLKRFKKATPSKFGVWGDSNS